MSISLEVKLKDGKNLIEAFISDDSVSGALSAYDELAARFPQGSPAPTAPKGKKSAEPEAAPADDSTDAPTGGNVVDIKTAPPAATATATGAPTGTGRAARKLFEQYAITLNETALLWATRMTIAIPQFNGKSPTELLEQLNFRKPLAVMTVDELNEVVQLVKTTLGQFAEQEENGAVQAYLKVIAAVDSLQSGTEAEWELAKASVSAEEWGTLLDPKNAVLANAAKAEKAKRQELLQVASLAANAAAS